MAAKYPRPWDWAKEVPPKLLSSSAGTAPKEIGFYELGFLEDGDFEAQYAGRAMGITLRERLAQHYRNSHNKRVRRFRNTLYFRCKTFPTDKLTAYVEAVSIAAFEYPWNRRNEWKQHWALET